MVRIPSRALKNEYKFHALYYRFMRLINCINEIIALECVNWYRIEQWCITQNQDLDTM